MASARATIFSIAFRCDRCASRLFAAGLLLVKDQIPQKKGMKGAKRPFGHAGDLARLPQKETRQLVANPQRELWAIL